MFAQLKRVLENENTKKENEKKREPVYPVQPPAARVEFLSGTGHMGRPVLYKPTHHGQVRQLILPCGMKWEYIRQLDITTAYKCFSLFMYTID